jgi:hypothetical protein
MEGYYLSKSVFTIPGCNETDMKFPVPKSR